MSDKRARKSAKRKKRQREAASQRIARDLAKRTAGLVTGDGQPTPPDQLLETLASPDVPESEWPEEWRERIKTSLQRFAEIGQVGHVKRRPNGSLTVMGDSHWIEPEDS